jgi:hypothetical protein
VRPTRVFYHEPTFEAHDKGPVHFQDSEDGVHIRPVTVCGTEIPPEWHTHIVNGITSLPPTLDALCQLCVTMDLLRCVPDKIDRLIMSEMMLITGLKSATPDYKVTGTITGRIVSSEPPVQNIRRDVLKEGTSSGD